MRGKMALLPSRYKLWMIPRIPQLMAFTGLPKPQQRLDNIPDFIRPMARREIERLVKERGGSEITAEMMEEAKEKFMKFM